MHRVTPAFACLGLVASLLLSGSPSPADSGAPRCQILDGPTSPTFDISLGYIPRAGFGDYGRSALLEVDADYRFAYFRDVLWGDLDLALRLRSTMLHGSAQLQLPDQLAGVAVDTGWTLRWVNGSALQVRARPGLYCDMEEFADEVVRVPFSLALVRSFTPYLSGMAGAEVRPDFDRDLIPLIGLVWAIGDGARVEAMVPRSRVSVSVARYWQVYASGEWVNTTFTLREKGDYDRDALTMEDFRAALGTAYAVTDDVRLRCEAGWVFERSAEFEEAITDLPREFEIEDRVFVRVGLGGPF